MERDCGYTPKGTCRAAPCARQGWYRSPAARRALTCASPQSPRPPHTPGRTTWEEAGGPINCRFADILCAVLWKHPTRVGGGGGAADWPPPRREGHHTVWPWRSWCPSPGSPRGTPAGRSRTSRRRRRRRTPRRSRATGSHSPRPRPPGFTTQPRALSTLPTNDPR